MPYMPAKTEWGASTSTPSGYNKAPHALTQVFSEKSKQGLWMAHQTEVSLHFCPLTPPHTQVRQT